jgi:hypothetical protein
MAAKGNTDSASAEKIRSLWKDPTFVGSFTGLSTFLEALHEKNINVSYRQLFHIMKNVPEYVTTTRPRRKFPTRKMSVHGYGALWQADLAEMPIFEDYKYFLLAIDIYSRKIFTYALKTKTSNEVSVAFDSLFDEAGSKCNKLETDQGTEFIGNRSYFKRNNIYFRIKTGPHKASFAEHSIYVVKKRLYRLLRSLMSQNWPKYLPVVVEHVNNTPSNVIGGLRPAQIKSAMDNPIVDQAVGLRTYPTPKSLLENEKKYKEDKSQIQVGDFCYVDIPGKLFDKSFDTQVRIKSLCSPSP